MLITKDFVMLNFPKTGSNFARNAITSLYKNRQSKFKKFLVNKGFVAPDVIELMMPNIDDMINFDNVGPHGTFRQIPAKYNNKPIVSIIRNPFSRYVSTYFFKWWEKYPPADMQEIRSRYPDFPHLSFADYYEMEHIYTRENRLLGIAPKIELGLHTIQFIQFYFGDPKFVLNKIDDEYIDSKQYQKDMAPVQFIHQENLRKELVQFLVRVGVSQRDDAEFIGSMDKINVTEKDKNINIQNIVTDANFREKIIKREKLIFSIFPEYLTDNKWFE